MSTLSDVVGVVREGFSMVRTAVTLLAPGSAARTVEIPENGITLKEALESAGTPWSAKQTYSDGNGNVLSPDSIVSPGAVVSAISTQSNG